MTVRCLCGGAGVGVGASGPKTPLSIMDQAQSAPFNELMLQMAVGGCIIKLHSSTGQEGR